MWQQPIPLAHGMCCGTSVHIVYRTHVLSVQCYIWLCSSSSRLIYVDIILVLSRLSLTKLCRSSICEMRQSAWLARLPFYFSLLYTAVYVCFPSATLSKISIFKQIFVFYLILPFCAIHIFHSRIRHNHNYNDKPDNFIRCVILALLSSFAHSTRLSLYIWNCSRT